MAKLIWRNLLRNKRRTLLTLASVGMALLLLSLLGSVLSAMGGVAATSADRLVVRHAISLTFDMPKAYEQRLRTLDHVLAVTPLNWFQGTYKDNRPQNFFPRFGADPETLLDVFPEYRISQQDIAVWRRERDSFIAGKTLVEEQGWEPGDRIYVKGDIYPVDLDLVLRGVFAVPENRGGERQLFFHWQYVEEAMDNPGIVGTYFLKLDSPDSVPVTIQAAEALFSNAAEQVRAETEEAFQLSFLEMMGNVRLLFGVVGLAIIVSIFLITANTMAMAARERATEVAVLRTLGFRRPRVVAIVVFESLAVGLLGALLGALLAVGLLRAVGPALEQAGFLFSELSLDPSTLALVVAIGIGLGLVSGLVPAWNAARFRIVDGLRRVA
jgi:putative ABC transport system permease protein